MYLDVLNSDLSIVIPKFDCSPSTEFHYFSHSRCGCSFKTVQQANKKINGTKAALVPSLTFTCYLNSHAAGIGSFRRSLKSSVGPAVLKKPCTVVYLICRKSALQLLNTRRAAFLCNYNTKLVRSACQYFDWKSPLEIDFPQKKILMSICFLHLLQNQIAGKRFYRWLPKPCMPAAWLFK